MKHKKQKDENTAQDSVSRVQNNQHLRHALAPFEDDLIAQLPSAEQIIQDARVRQQKNKQRFKKILSIAVLGMGIGMLYVDPAYDQQTLVTAIGESKHIILHDGSQVHLNTNSRLSISYHILSRKVELQQGEVTFHVKHNSWHTALPWLERTFNVYVDDIRVQDIGTIFNVRKFEKNEVQVAVLKGRVRIHTPQQHSLDLSTGQSTYTSRGQYRDVSSQDVVQLVAWQQGYLYFNDQPLAQVLAELNRYGKLPVSITDKNIAELRVSGQVNLNDRQQFISALPTFAPVKLKYEKDGEVTVYKK